jgi:hypothetical protein
MQGEGWGWGLRLLGVVVGCRCRHQTRPGTLYCSVLLWCHTNLQVQNSKTVLLPVRRE